VPDNYKPVRMQRLNSWRTRIGLLALIATIVIVMNPEFYALGILGDPAFFDLLVLAIGLQLQTILARVWCYAGLGFSIMKRIARWRFYTTCSLLLLAVHNAASAIQKSRASQYPSDLNCPCFLLEIFANSKESQ